jgi:hypothetical protein
MARKKQPRTTKKARAMADQAAALAEYAGTALVAAEQLGIKAKAVERFPLDDDERATVAQLPALAAKLKKKLAKNDDLFTVAEVASMVMTAAESFVDAEPKRQVALLVVAKKLMDCLQANIARSNLRPAKRTKASRVSPDDAVYQFKITLLESHPPIWRRIQVRDCTLDKLHELIQTAMGWTNSHLHHFKVKDQLYGDPDLMQENFEGMDYKDSTTTKISDILPRTGRRFRLQYEYDFGDSWHHEVLFEGVVRADPKAKYPLCLEGARGLPAGGLRRHLGLPRLRGGHPEPRPRAARGVAGVGWRQLRPRRVRSGEGDQGDEEGPAGLEEHGGVVSRMNQTTSFTWGYSG